MGAGDNKKIAFGKRSVCFLLFHALKKSFDEFDSRVRCVRFAQFGPLRKSISDNCQRASGPQ